MMEVQSVSQWCISVVHTVWGHGDGINCTKIEISDSMILYTRRGTACRKLLLCT